MRMIDTHTHLDFPDFDADRTELEDCRWFTRAETRAILSRTHPEGINAPPPMAIAHHLIKAWAEGGA